MFYQRYGASVREINICGVWRRVNVQQKSQFGRKIVYSNQTISEIEFKIIIVIFSPNGSIYKKILVKNNNHERRIKKHVKPYSERVQSSKLPHSHKEVETRCLAVFKKKS